MNLSGIKAVTFDAGGTLIEPWPSVGHVYAAVAAKFGNRDISAEKLNRAFVTAWKTKQSFDYSLEAWAALVEEVFQEHLGARVSGALFHALYQRFAEADAWHVYDDVRPPLELLCTRGYRLGVVSNWDNRLTSLLTRLKLGHYFEMVVLSVDVGVTKPARKIFNQALALLNLAPPDVLHIGDSLAEDVAAARACGMSALLLDRTGGANNSIPSLNALASLLPPTP